MEDLIKVETAILAKSKGFKNKMPKGYYMHGTKKSHVKILLWTNSESKDPEFGYAPTQSLLRKWLRESHKINFEITVSFDFFNVSRICIWNEHSGENQECIEEALKFRDFKSYELAVERALVEALRIIK